MNAFIHQALRTQNVAFTENGDITYSTTLDSVLDLFGNIGSMRMCSDETVVNMFNLAFVDDPELALRVVLWGRDAREGAGERRAFRVIAKSLASSKKENKQDAARVLLNKVVELGRWDDVLCFFDTNLERDALRLIRKGIENKDGLCAKWLPREKSSKADAAKKIRAYLKLTPSEYRKTLVNLSSTVEQQMSAKRWSEINYEHVPSIAAARYQSAFLKQDEHRYQEYLDKLKEGKAKVNAGAIYPHQVITGLMRSPETFELAEAQWATLPDFVNEGVSFLPLVDVSGSMMCPAGMSSVSCLDVAVALGLYLAERNKTSFKNYFITFSEAPKLVRLKGSLSDRLESMRYAEWGFNTNLDLAMDLILRTAVGNKLKQEDLPTHLIVLSDMQFDDDLGPDGNRPVSLRTKQAFESAGYTCPNIIWWNLRYTKTTPVTVDDTGVALVSGFSPSVMKSLLADQTVDPTKIMLETIMKDRYSF